MCRDIYFGSLCQGQTLERKSSRELSISIVKHLIVSVSALWITSFGKKTFHAHIFMHTDSNKLLFCTLLTYGNKYTLSRLQINNWLLFRLKRCTHYPNKPMGVYRKWLTSIGLNSLFAPASDWLSLGVALSNILLCAPTVLITWSLWSVLSN